MLPCTTRLVVDALAMDTSLVLLLLLLAKLLLLQVVLLMLLLVVLLMLLQAVLLVLLQVVLLMLAVLPRLQHPLHERAADLALHLLS